MWTPEQIIKVEKYLKSKRFSDKMKKLHQQHEEKERAERLEHIDWWIKIKDEPFI